MSSVQESVTTKEQDAEPLECTRLEQRVAASACLKIKVHLEYSLMLATEINRIPTVSRQIYNN